MNAKKIAIVKFTVAGLCLLLAGLFLTKKTAPINIFGYGWVGIMVILAGFAIYNGILAAKDAKSGLNFEDELSKKITEKAAAKAFKTSIYMWLFSLFFIDEFGIHTVSEFKIFIAFGMVAMALIFFFTRLYMSKVGIVDEDKN